MSLGIFSGQWTFVIVWEYCGWSLTESICVCFLSKCFNTVSFVLWPERYLLLVCKIAALVGWICLWGTPWVAEECFAQKKVVCRLCFDGRPLTRGQVNCGKVDSESGGDRTKIWFACSCLFCPESYSWVMFVLLFLLFIYFFFWSFSFFFICRGFSDTL